MTSCQSLYELRARGVSFFGATRCRESRVPLALLDAVQGQTIMLEPRRLAARAAERLANLGEHPVKLLATECAAIAKRDRELRL